MDQIPLIASYYPLLPPEERIPVTAFTFPLILLAPAPVFLLAYLSLRPNTLFVRLAILPFAVAPALYVLVGFRWMSWDLAPWNFALGLLCLLSVAKAVEFGTDTTGFPRLVRTRASNAAGTNGTSNGTANGNGNHLSNGHASKRAEIAPQKEEQSVALVDYPTRGNLVDTLDLIGCCRGQGWAHGEGTYVPPFPFPSLSGSELRRHWLRYAAFQSTLYFLLFDTFLVLIKLHPNFQAPGPASIFLPSLAPVSRYGVAFSMSFFTGMSVIFGFHAAYNSFGLLCVLFLGQDPRSWPPVQEVPWHATNLHELWAKRWHQLLRRSFLVTGGWPLQALIAPIFGSAAGEFALLLGAFLASGALHMIGQLTIGIPLGWGSVLYFGLQAVGIALERVFRVLTRKRVGGVAGWVWVILWVVGGGMIASEEWHLHGLGSGIIIPPMLSPMQAVILPLAKRIRGQS